MRKWTHVAWVNLEASNGSWLGSHGDDCAKGEFYGLMWIVKERQHISGTRSAIMKTLGTLLHETVHAMLYTFGCRCQCAAETAGISGHGPSWVKTAKAMEKELKHRFDGFGSWDLSIGRWCILDLNSRQFTDLLA